MNNQEVEAEIQAKGLTAPRITEADINACIVRTQYHVFSGSQLTVCCLTLRNGFTVTGESACASPENFDEELGRKIAYGNAHGKVWAFEAYLLKQRLWIASHDLSADARANKEFWDNYAKGRAPEPLKNPSGQLSKTAAIEDVEGLPEKVELGDVHEALADLERQEQDDAAYDRSADGLGEAIEGGATKVD